jgi:condensin complex subunit 3
MLLKMKIKKLDILSLFWRQLRPLSKLMTKRTVIAEDDLFSSICSLFNESQFHVSSHRKNVQSLRKLHAKAAETGHEAEVKFLQTFCHCLHVILGMKKADEVSSKLMRFLVGFVVRSADAITKEPSTGEFVDRFIEGLMRHVLDHLDAKEKLVRTRLCQIMVACLNSVQELT